MLAERNFVISTCVRNKQRDDFYVLICMYEQRVDIVTAATEEEKKMFVKAFAACAYEVHIKSSVCARIFLYNGRVVFVRVCLVFSRYNRLTNDCGRVFSLYRKLYVHICESTRRTQN